MIKHLLWLGFVPVFIPQISIAEIVARNLPQENKILFFLGQNSDVLSEYKLEVIDLDPNAVRPGGITLYTTLSFVDDENYDGIRRGKPLDSLLDFGNWGDGEHNLKRSMRDFPSASLAIGLDLTDHADSGVDIRECQQRPIKAIAGLEEPEIAPMIPIYQSYVDQMIKVLKGTNRSVFLRIGYEFDGPWNCYSPGVYKAAFRYIKKRIDYLQADNIATVWQSSSAPVDGKEYYNISKKGHFDLWYPGDNYVDWVGMSTFLMDGSVQYQAPNIILRWIFLNDFIKNQGTLLDFARSKAKPVMLAEATPKGFDLKNKKISLVYKRKDSDYSSKEMWDSWFASWFSFIKNNRDVIRAVAYINNNWAESPMWRCDEKSQFWPGESVPVNADKPKQPACPGGSPWGDTRIQVNPYIFERFEKELKKDHFVQITE